jgi:heme exporter protein A
MEEGHVAQRGMGPEAERAECPAIEIEGLWKLFGDVEALRGLDLRVDDGQFLTIFGPNGAGKTTLIKVLATLMRPTEGQVRVGGADIVRAAQDVRRRVGLVSHATYLYPQLTAFENLMFYGRLYGVRDSKARAAALAGRLGLTSRLHDRVGAFSRGMQQRLSIARALLHDPDILLLDEPFTGLDRQACRVLSEILQGIRDRRRTVLMTTHNLEEGLELSERVAIQAGGRLVFESSAAQIDRSTFSDLYFDAVTEA